MKIINILCFFSALVIATSSKSSQFEAPDSDKEKPITYHAPTLTYNDIKHIPTDLERDELFTFNNQQWVFSWACAKRPIITSIWSPEDHNFVVELLEDEGLNNNVCGNLRFASYTIYAQKKSEPELIKTFLFTFFLKVPSRV